MIVVPVKSPKLAQCIIKDDERFFKEDAMSCEDSSYHRKIPLVLDVGVGLVGQG